MDYIDTAESNKKVMNLKSINNIFSKLNWDKSTVKLEQNPKKIKVHSVLDTNSDWRDINTEVIDLKRYKNNKYNPKSFKDKCWNSTLLNNTNEKQNNNENDKSSFKSLINKNSSASNLKNSSYRETTKDNKNLSSFNEPKDRKLFYLKTSNVLNEIMYGKQDKKESLATLSTNVSKKEECLTKYEVDIPESLYIEDVKKILNSKGLHVYNLKEKRKFGNGELDTKLEFKVRNFSNQDSEQNKNMEKIAKELNECGLNINLTNQEKSPPKDSRFFPVQAKWNDNNLKYYHLKDEMKRLQSCEGKDYKLKENFKFDQISMEYKNNRVNIGKKEIKKEKSKLSMAEKSKISNNNSFKEKVSLKNVKNSIK